MRMLLFCYKLQELGTQERTLPHTFDEEEAAGAEAADEVGAGDVRAPDLDVGGDLVPGHVAVSGEAREQRSPRHFRNHDERQEPWPAGTVHAVHIVGEQGSCVHTVVSSLHTHAHAQAQQRHAHASRHCQSNQRQSSCTFIYCTSIMSYHSAMSIVYTVYTLHLLNRSINYASCIRFILLGSVYKRIFTRILSHLVLNVQFRLTSK